MTNVGVVGAAGSVMLVREHSGLLADHDLRGLSDLTALASDFEFGGSAPPDHRRADSGPDGLRISVGPHAPSGWEGFFAVTRIDFPAMAVFHVAMTRDTVEIPRTDQSGEAVFAVQTASTKRTGILNYVLAASSTNDGQTGWLVGHAKGLHANAELTVLWECAPEPSVGAKVSQDITLRTDGRSTLQVWFGTQLVYAVREGLHLEVDPPLQPYLEVQALEIGYASTFTDFWVAENDVVVVHGLQPGDRASLARSDGGYSRGTASSSGEVRLALAMPAARGSGIFNVGSRPDLQFGPFQYAGGDRYRLVKADDATANSVSAQD